MRLSRPSRNARGENNATEPKTPASAAPRYGAPCFARAARARAVEPPAKAPIARDALPAFARPALADAAKRWARLVVADSRALPPPPWARRAPFAGAKPASVPSRELLPRRAS